MAGNTPNVSRDSFDFSKQYGPVVHQQGVPLMDSDVNELMDNLWIRGTHVVNHATIGDCRLEHVKLDGTSTANTGMKVIQHATSTVNDFTVTDGWAMVGGVCAPSTATSPPGSFDYDDQIMFTGAVTSVGGGDITDSSKNWLAVHVMTGCRVKMTSGAESGNTFTVTALASATSLTLSGGTGSIATTDTYEIYPPALTTPSGGDRDDLVYLMVFFDDIATEEDSAITHPGSGIESVHKSKIRAIVRVLENSTTMPTPTEANLLSYGMRYLEMATLERLNGNANITTAMITNADNIRGPLAHAEAEDIVFDDTVMTGIGYPVSTYVQDAVDNIITELNTSDGAGLIQGAAISDSPDSVGAGTLQAMLTSILDLVNNRVRNVHPTASPTSPVLIWRSHNITSDAAVTGDTVSLYISDDGFAICRGMYLASATQAYDAPISPEATASAIMVRSGKIGIYQRTLTGSPWDWRFEANWTFYFNLQGGGTVFGADSSLNHIVSIPDNGYVRYSAPASLGDANYESRQLYSGGYPINIANKGNTRHYLVNGELGTPGTGDNVNPVDTGLNMASFQGDCDPGLFRFLFTTQYRSSPPYASGHDLPSTNWSARMTIGKQASDKGASEDYIYNCFEADGNVYEEIHVNMSHSLFVSTGTIRSAMNCACNFRNRFNTAPTTTDVSGFALTNCDPLVVYNKDNWGFEITAAGTAGAGSYTLGCYGNVECYT